MPLSTYIAHGAPDHSFAEQLRDELRAVGIKTFFFKDDATPGQKLHRMMRTEIGAYDKIILICSKDSLNRSGVLNEIEETLQREAREGGAELLLPITLDDFVFKEWYPPRPDLAQAVRDRVVADFRGAKSDLSKFTIALNKLVAALGGPEPITYLRAKSNLEILDTRGHKTTWRIERTVVPLNNNITELPCREIFSSGQLSSVKISSGNLRQVLEGGAPTFYAVFDHPLPVGQEFTHVIEMELTDCFRSTDGDYVVRFENHYEIVEICIKLPKQRPPQNPRAVHVVHGREFPCTGFSVSEDATTLTLRLTPPQVGTNYKIAWNW